MADRDWKAYHMERRAKRALNRENTLELLRSHGIPHRVIGTDGGFVLVKGSIHLRPSSGEWVIPNTTTGGRGIRSLLNYLEATK